MDFSASSILERIESLVSLKELRTDLGFAQSTIATWKHRNALPRSDDLYKIAKHLNVSMEWLLTGEEDSNALPGDVQKAVSYLVSVPEEERGAIIAVIKAQTEYWKNHH